MAKDYKIDRISVPRFNEANGFYTTTKKSLAMAKIKGQNTKPEIILRKALWALNIKYRINVKAIPGKPDILMRKYKLAIFVDGEFWHGYNWGEKKGKIKTNRAFWIPKIERNMQRDAENLEKLTELGFHVLRFWEHEIKKDLSGCLQKIVSYIETANH
ncbi:very short patch repair endonuclease [Pedobacter sp. L105]|uniref:very short patch repair endonuclease n=1 Tax=Pedobacter sp. L105 TaxID=1641871 RepID=UPI00131DD426|nr:very short patch repair endonuclease [Pedobacter sp. L105]